MRESQAGALQWGRRGGMWRDLGNIYHVPVICGGLIRRADTYGDNGVPLLKDVPLLGKLFSNTSEASERTELLVFLKPRIIRSPAAAREVTDSLRKGLRGLDAMMTDAEKRK